MSRVYFTAFALALAGAIGCDCGDGGGPGTADGSVPGMDAARPDSMVPPGVDAGAPDAGPAPTDLVRFVVMGDVGEGNTDQREVAVQIRDLCAVEGCDFVILLGDNIYDSGVSGTDDPQWQTKFEEPYRDVDLPFYAVLGNHDYGGTLPIIGDQGGLGNEFGLGMHEVDYTAVSDKWMMPATHYTFTWGNVGFIALDTNSILWGDTSNGDQSVWYPTALMEVSGADWVIALGHHPYRSNGQHGNAGSYESIEVGGVDVPNPLPILNGAGVQSFFDSVVCGTVDFYMAGHDHNRQWLNEPGALCGAELVVSGAGAKVKDLVGRGNTAFYEDGTMEGFLYVVVDGDQLTGTFYDKTGAENFSRTVMRTP